MVDLALVLCCWENVISRFLRMKKWRCRVWKKDMPRRVSSLLFLSFLSMHLAPTMVWNKKVIWDALGSDQRWFTETRVPHALLVEPQSPSPYFSSLWCPHASQQLTTVRWRWMSYQWKDGDAWHAWHARACRDAPLPRKCGGVDEEKRTEACMVKYLQFSFYSGPKRDLKN